MIDPYPVELFARCMLAMYRADMDGLIKLLSGGVGSWSVRLQPPPDDARGSDPAPSVRVDRLDTGASVQREIPEMAALAELIDPERATRAFLEGVLASMIELGAPRP